MNIFGENKYHGQFCQDKYLNEFVFFGKKNGVFVEIGAYDGIGLSNTCFFEKELSWTGICVEPMPKFFKKLQDNRKCICVDKCISNTNKNARFLHVIRKKDIDSKTKNNLDCSLFCGDEILIDRVVTPFTLLDKNRYEMVSGLIEFYDEENLSTIKEEIDMINGEIEILNIDCMTPNELLSMLPIKKIDYLSIDTEGSELAILQSIDYTKFDIDIISVEMLSTSVDKLDHVMRSNGYGLMKELGWDLIYRKQ